MDLQQVHWNRYACPVALRILNRDAARVFQGRVQDGAVIPFPGLANICQASLDLRFKERLHGVFNHDHYLFARLVLGYGLLNNDVGFHGQQELFDEVMHDTGER